MTISPITYQVTIFLLMAFIIIREAGAPPNAWSNHPTHINQSHIQPYYSEDLQMNELYPLFTYTGIGFCALIALSWGISLFDKIDSREGQPWLLFLLLSYSS